MVPHAPAPGNEREIAGASSAETLAIVWRRRYLILLTVVAALAIGHLYAGSLTPIYSATAAVMFRSNQTSVPDPQSILTGGYGDYRQINSQIELITSRSLMGRVVDALDLTKDPEFNPSIASPAAETASGWLSVGDLMRRLGLAGPPDPTPVAVTPEQARRDAIDILIGMTHVSPLDDSFVFYVSVENPDSRKSALIANTIADQYLQNQIAMKYEATEKAAVWLSNRVLELKQSLERADAAVAEFVAGHQNVSEDAVTALAAQLVSMKRTRAQVGDSRDAATARLTELQALLPTDRLADIAEAADSMRLENIAAAIASNGGRDAPQNAGAVARFRTEVQAVLDRLGREAAQAGQNIANLDALIAGIERKQDAQAAGRVRLAQLEREAQAASVIYETFLGKEKETSIQEGGQQADAVVISEAWPPNAPAKPHTLTILGVAFLLGLGVSGGIVVLLELLDQTFSTPEELERFTKLPLLGLVPRAPVMARSNILKYVVERPNSPFVEAVRNLRTSIHLAGVDGDMKVVTVASAVEGEGKTSLALSLGHVSASQSNRRVLVMDCDLRRRRLTQTLGGRGMPGIIAYFGGTKTVDEIIHRVDGADFDVIFADRSPKITADIFASQKFEELIAEARRHYDMIVIDTPPVLALTDVRVIASQADLLLLTVTWNSTRRRLVRAALNALELAQARKTAVVFNRMNIQKSIGYYGSYYYQR